MKLWQVAIVSVFAGGAARYLTCLLVKVLGGPPWAAPPLAAVAGWLVGVKIGARHADVPWTFPGDREHVVGREKP